MGTRLGNVRDVRQVAEVQIGEGVADIVEFKAQVNGHEATVKGQQNPSLAGSFSCFGIVMVLCDLYLKRFDLTKGFLFDTFEITVWYKLCR